MTAAEVRIVEIMEDEDGEVGWAVGHVDPALMVLSLVVERMQNVGADQAMETMLIGGPFRFVTHPRGPWTYGEQMEHANAILSSVRHVWLRQDPMDEEKMHNAVEGEPGATRWTRVDIPW